MINMRNWSQRIAYQLNFELNLLQLNFISMIDSDEPSEQKSPRTIVGPSQLVSPLNQDLSCLMLNKTFILLLTNFSGS